MRIQTSFREKTQLKELNVHKEPLPGFPNLELETFRKRKIALCELAAPQVASELIESLTGPSSSRVASM